MGTFAEYLARKVPATEPTKEEHPATIIADAMGEARELGQSVAGMFGTNSRRRKLERLDLKLRGP